MELVTSLVDRIYFLLFTIPKGLIFLAEHFYPYFVSVVLILSVLSFWKLVDIVQFIIRWRVTKENLFTAIVECRRQARAHQHTNHPVQHALEPHKKEKAELIISRTKKLPRIDPLKKDAEKLVRDLLAGTSFEQTEKISNQFLEKYNRQ